MADAAGATRNMLARFSRLDTRTKLIGGGIVAVALALAALWLAAGDRGCSSRAEVEARVALVSSNLQQAAAQGEITVERLADSVKRLNAAATTYEATQDHQAYCQALDALRSEVDLRK